MTKCAVSLFLKFSLLTSSRWGLFTPVLSTYNVAYVVGVSYPYHSVRLENSRPKHHFNWCYFATWLWLVNV